MGDDRTRTLDSSPEDGSGQQIGPYRLLQLLGEGGMGEVWEASQQHPVRRKVALKLIKAGMDSKQVIARFEAERQALALMDHPSVAKVFDAGATSAGRPWFAMELVRGEPIDTYCDRQRLSTTERLELFRQVCAGVQHAHQKGIIHRDLKPSNVLVSLADDRPVPKIIDFGVAKATQQPLTEKTMFTAMGIMIGTPEFMSPEQAELGGLDVDTRTDVYSLGVMLYLLLVGVLPFESEKMRGAGLDEIRRTIREVEPSKPSTRLTTLGGDSTETAKRRRTDPPGLRRLLAGDLDWITMRALEKERTRRYASPAEMAEDIGRHLRHEPVLAGAPSTLYRVKKFVRRHRLGVAAGAAVLVTLVGGLVGTGVAMVRAQRAERVASRQVELLSDMFDALDPGGERGSTASPEQLLAVAEERIERDLADQPLVQARLKSTMGRIYMNLGDQKRALPLYEETLAIREELLGPSHLDTVESMIRLGGLQGIMGDYPAARSILERALAIHEENYGPEHPATAYSLSELGFTLWRDGDLQGAKRYFERVLAIREKEHGPDHPLVADTLYLQAVVLRDLGEYEPARAGFERAIAIREAALGPEHTAVAWILENYGYLLDLVGEPEAAKEQYERALAIQEKIFGPDHFTAIEPLARLSANLLATGDLEGARQCAERMLAIQEKMYGREHHFVSYGLNAVARVARREGKLEEARGHYERAVQQLEQGLGPEHPQVAYTLGYLGRMLFSAGDAGEALPLFERARAIMEKAYGEDSLRAAAAGIDVAWARVRLGDVEPAREVYRSAAAVYGKSLEGQHVGVDRRFFNLGCLAALVGERDDALDWLRRALDRGLDPALLRTDPDLASLRGDPEFEELAP